MIKRIKLPKWSWSIFFIGILICLVSFISAKQLIKITSTDKYCQSCHIHPQADDSWKKSAHFYNKSGVIVHCVECHLPPKENNNYLIEKAKTGLKDLYGFYFKDSASFNWEDKRSLEHARKIVYNESCIKCHQNLFTPELTADGGTAHLYYENNAEKLGLVCINCHQFTGHYNPNYIHGAMTGVPVASTQNKNIYLEPAKVTTFENYTEYIPSTPVSFNMIAVKGGSFKMGSPEDESFRKPDEGPVRNVTVSPFFIGETEVTWDEYWSFFGATMAEGRSDPNEQIEHNENNPDAISGPTPAFGSPDQGWGQDKRPAITISHYAAKTYCQWLSKVTGKKYRLPTEAEWEFACRAGTETPYFFEGEPTRFNKKGLFGKIKPGDTAVINTYVVYVRNSPARTQEPDFVKPNPLGIRNMLGNVMEYCSDWYAENAYSPTEAEVVNPIGPEEGTEHVVRGGNYSFDAKDLRSASREKTESLDWLKTDPQLPKSIWWLTDMKGIGFRVVCEPDSSMSIQ